MSPSLNTATSKEKLKNRRNRKDTGEDTVKNTKWIGSLLEMLFLLAACSAGNGDTSIEEASSMEKIVTIQKASIQVPNQPLPIIVEFEEDGGA